MPVVVKQIDVHTMDHEQRVSARAEAILLSKLVHPAILTHYESFEDDVSVDEGAKRRTLCIVTEFCDRGDLARLIAARGDRLFLEEEVLDIFCQLALAVAYIHNRKVLHRDLKPGNVMITKDGQIRLGDFGISKLLAHTHAEARTIVGTPIYLSPEVVEGRGYGNKADVWSLGVILYELMTLKRPFSGSSIPSLVRRILRGKFPPLPSCYSEELRGLVSLMLSRSASTRPSVAAILQLPLLKPFVEKFVARCREANPSVPRDAVPRELRSLLDAPSEPEVEAPSVEAFEGEPIVPAIAVVAASTSTSPDRDVEAKREPHLRAAPAVVVPTPPPVAPPPPNRWEAAVIQLKDVLSRTALHWKSLSKTGSPTVTFRAVTVPQQISLLPPEGSDGSFTLRMERYKRELELLLGEAAFVSLYSAMWQSCLKDSETLLSVGAWFDPGFFDKFSTVTEEALCRVVPVTVQVICQECAEYISM
jgi:NIMA (never in mitosis gene a)-related kinase 1/4/5